MTQTASTPNGAGPGDERSAHRRRLRPQPGGRLPRRVSGPIAGRGVGAAPGRSAIPDPVPRRRGARRAAPSRVRSIAAPALAFLRALPDHPLLDRLVRGRAWIPVLGVLLAGVVAMQVEMLKLGASIGRSVQTMTEQQSQNERLRSSISSLSNPQRIESEAAGMGMVMPGPGAIVLPAQHNGEAAAANIHAPDSSVFNTPPTGASQSSAASSGTGSSSAGAASSGAAGVGAAPSDGGSSNGGQRVAMTVLDRRIASLLIVFVALLGVALLRAAYLESIKSGGLQRAAADQQVTRDIVPAVRGTITDRNGVQLALSESADNVTANPHLIKDPVSVAKQVAPLLGKPVPEVVSLVDERHTGYVPLARLIPADRATEIQKLNINGISLTPDTIRDYPRDSQAAQVLGYVGFSGEGLDGLEYQYNSALQGTNGLRKDVNDAIGQPISVDEVRLAQPGKPLQLTIDSALQSEMEQVLAGVGTQYSPAGATAIAVDPSTGAILGLANWPSVNANHPFASLASAWEDQAVGFSYEPGSTFKAITVAGALQDGRITPSTEFSIPPVLHVADREIHDDVDHGYETLSVGQILQVSSNIGADEIGALLGAKQFDYWVHRFGFGSPTGVDLPGEQRGIVLHWWQYSGSSMGNLPFGQGESVTPMQIVAAYDAIANGGTLRAPHIVEAIGGKPVGLPAGRRILSPAVALELREMLRGVFADGGTASGAAIPGYDLAGKTGTANIAVDGHYSANGFVASFIGMVPTVDPKLVVAVVVDQPQGSIFGGSVAAPAFQKIVGWAVPYFGISPCPAPCAPSVLNGTTP